MKANATKVRVDRLLVERGLAYSRENARALIIAGDVLIDGQKSDKPGRSVSSESQVSVTAPRSPGTARS